MNIHVKGFLLDIEQSVYYNIDPHRPMRHFKLRLCREYGLEYAKWQFIFDGGVIQDNDTAEYLDIKQGFQLDVRHVHLLPPRIPQ
jgi:hypothetical protein